MATDAPVNYPARRRCLSVCSPTASSTCFMNRPGATNHSPSQAQVAGSCSMWYKLNSTDASLRRFAAAALATLCHIGSEAICQSILVSIFFTAVKTKRLAVSQFPLLWRLQRSSLVSWTPYPVQPPVWTRICTPYDASILSLAYRKVIVQGLVKVCWVDRQ